MFGNLSKCLIWGLVLATVFCLAGCGSQTGQTDDEADTTTAEATSSETCAVCHESGRVAAVDMVHRSGSDAAVLAQITNAEIDAETGRMTAYFNLSNNGVALSGVPASSVRFTAAQLRPAVAGNSSYWQSYVNRVETKGETDPGTAPAGSKTQATSETATASGGAFVDNGDGSYAYTFSFDIRNVTSPVAVAYDENLTHRISMQIGGNISNPVYDFRPLDGAVTGITTREIATVSSCNACHDRLGLHGGDRVDVGYCVTCHNPGTADANSGNTVDMKVMIHKIHMGENLPSVRDGGKYAIWGYRNSEHDYSHVRLPMDVRNCDRCHNSKVAETRNGDNWKTVANMETCVSCHENTSFVSPPPDGKTLHKGGVIADNSECALCHKMGDISVETAHSIPAMVAASDFQYNIIDIQNTAPGQFPVVRFSVTNPKTGAAYDMADPQFTSGSVSRIFVLIGWDTGDYHNTGSGNTPGLPVSINAVAQSAGNGDGTFSVTSPVAVPVDAKGSGVVAIEGHPAADPDADGTFDLRVPVKNVFEYFPITDESAVARRQVVDMDNCNACHGNLSLHGNNRTGAIDVCVICHNGNATDVNRRPDASLTADGNAEMTIDFKYMIHGIHGAGMRVNELVVYGYGNSEHNFGHVEYPGNLGNCEACHLPGTQGLPLDPLVQTTAVSTGSDLATPTDDRYATPTSSVCASCHDAELPKIHMQQNGGGFDIGGLADPGAAEVVQPAGHPTAPNCTTAFACHG